MAISWTVSKKVTFTPQFLLIHSNSIIQFQLSNFFSLDLTVWPVKGEERSPVHLKHSCGHGKKRSFWFCCQYQRRHSAAFDFLLQTSVVHMQSNKEPPSDQGTACRQDQISCLCIESHTASPCMAPYMTVICPNIGLQWYFLSLGGGAWPPASSQECVDFPWILCHICWLHPDVLNTLRHLNNTAGLKVLLSLNIKS